MILTVASIEHRHGTNFYVAFDDKDLEEQLYEYISEWWTKDSLIPKNKEEAIDDYFEDVYEEWLTVDQVPVDDQKLEEVLNEYNS